jgi:multiple sugar transport system ATP-binding protein
MRTQIKRLHMAFGATSLYVTHDQTEAMTLADRIVALRDGRIEQMGSPDDLYARPVNRFVAGFIGSPTMNFLPARLVAEADGLFLAPEGGARLPVPPARAERYGRFAGKAVVLGLRPEDFTNTWTEESRDGSGVVPLDVTVEIAEPLGSDTLVFSRLGTSEIVGRLSAAAAPAVGSQVRLNAHLNRMHLFDPDTGVAL